MRSINGRKLRTLKWLCLVVGNVVRAGFLKSPVDNNVHVASVFLLVYLKLVLAFLVELVTSGVVAHIHGNLALLLSLCLPSFEFVRKEILGGASLFEHPGSYEVCFHAQRL